MAPNNSSDGIVDLHTHILAEVDDGSPDMETSLRMAEVAISEGVRVIVATPHAYDEGQDAAYSEYIRERFAVLRQSLKDAGLDLEVRLACEAHICPDLPERFIRGLLPCIGGRRRYALVELPNGQVPRFTGEVVFSLLMGGIIPIIAHPERNLVFQMEPEKLEKLVQQGALTQVTGGSLLLEAQHPYFRAARLFLRHGWVHVVASDMHLPISRELGWQPVEEKLVELSGPEMADRLIRKNPAAIVAGEDVPSAPLPYEPQVHPARRWISNVVRSVLKGTWESGSKEKNLD